MSGGVQAEQAYVDDLLRGIRLSQLIKHDADHDEKTHGNWAKGRREDSDIDTKPSKTVPKEPSQYRDQHQPTATYGAPGHDLSQLVNEDIYEHPEWYFSMHEKYNRLGARVIQSIRGRPDADVKIYRAVPKGANQINPGDWVTTVPSYAQLHGEGRLQGEYNLLTSTVKARELVWPGDSMVEFGWFPDNELSKHADHNQKSHGNWARGTSARQATGRIKDEGGFTLDYVAGDHPTKGWAVADGANEKVLNNAGQFLEEGGQPRLAREMRKYITSNDILKKEGWYWGAWYDTETDRIVFDTSRVIDNQAEARRFMISEDQDAMFNLETFEEIGNPARGR